jgi:hypothetical protein
MGKNISFVERKYVSSAKIQRSTHFMSVAAKPFWVCRQTLWLNKFPSMFTLTWLQRGESREGRKTHDQKPTFSQGETNTSLHRKRDLKKWLYFYGIPSRLIWSKSAIKTKVCLRFSANCMFSLHKIAKHFLHKTNC